MNGTDKNEIVYALDIGTRCIVGVVGTMQEGRLKVLDIEMAEHDRRAMVDGQIDNIQQVAQLARTVTERLEERLGMPLKRVCVAAAGRALRTEKGSFSLELPDGNGIGAEQISQLEAGAVSAAEALLQNAEENRQPFFLVGYTVSQYRLDGYPLTVLLNHSGKVAEVDIVATFLPGEVVESLYTAMREAGLQVASMTLEPIAAMNVAIPAELRLLNLALVDIGAGTTDIAICKDGSVTGYTMATIAGDEITEALMRAFLVDFQTAENMKRTLKTGEDCPFTDILGLEQTASYEEISTAINEPMMRLAEAIASQIQSLNGGAPSAVFLAGGGSKLDGLGRKVAMILGMDERRVATTGSNFAKSVFSEELKLDNPEYTTPLGIAVSAGMGLLNDSYVVLLNHTPAKLFRSGALTLRDVLLMNGYGYADMLGGTGKSVTITLNGQRVMLRGEPSVPAVLRLNEEEASLTTPVHAGDSIQFVPAKKGADVHKTVADLFAPGFQGRVLVNNKDCPLDTVLQQGDVVLTFERAVSSELVERSAPVVESASAPAEEEKPLPSREAVSAPPVEPEPVRHDPQPVPARPAPTQTIFGQPIPAGPAMTRELPGQAAPAQKPTPVRPSFMQPIHVLLNESPLTLPPKDSGQPYYLMDLLERSGLDFEHLDRPVYLAVNDVEAGFREIIRDQDRVTIRCV